MQLSYLLSYKMKRLFIIPLLVLYVSIAFGQEVKKEYFLNYKGRETDIVQYEYEYKLVNKKEIKNGYYKEFSYSGDLTVIGYYVDDKEDGEWIYFEDGAKIKMETYKMGILDGRYEEYGKNEVLRISGFYSNNKKVGIQTFYDSKGIRFSETENTSLGLHYNEFDNDTLKFEGYLDGPNRIGTWKYYYKNGHVMSILHYLKGQLDGTCESFYANGEKLSIKTFSNGKSLEQVIYYPTGNIFMQCRKDSTNRSEYNYFYANDNTSRKVSYNATGLASSQFYDSLGLPLTSGNYENGNGILLLYNGNQLVESESYKDYKLEGERKIYYPNGSIAKRAVYKNDEMDTVWCLYDTLGAVIDASCDADYGLINATIIDPFNKNPLQTCMNTTGFNENYTFGYDEDSNVKASFTNGIIGMYNFIGKNIEYPRLYLEMAKEGKVIMKFVIDANGKIDDIEPVRFSPSYELFYEASEECLSKMPSWSPALMFGLPVKSRFVIPISFKLE